MSVKSSLLEWEKRVKGVERRLGETVSKISKPKSLFGKLPYTKEQLHLLFAGEHIFNAATLIDPTKAVTIYSLFPYKKIERGRVASMELEKSMLRLKDVGV
jgi:hypothetical protein